MTHTWDLSQSLGHPHELDPELAEFALATARRVLPDPRRDADTPFADVRPAPEDADTHHRLAAWLGRTPLNRD
ncbi:hypothetical protein ACFY0F_22365 [Streptomyces sp. NPDC001544]|uniref:hypothetical protein n=1 Tax=Streptomyces sp. NPDC001544 TaxID=3364584 RepID=UPI0036CEC97E